MIKTAVIGFGLSAKVFHLPFLTAQAGYQLVALSSSQSDAQNFKSGLTVYPEAQQLISQTDAQLVVITSPNQSHYLLAKAALLAGKHLVVEKPFTLRQYEAEELADLAAQKNLQLCAFHNRRFDDDFLALQQQIQQGCLGQVRLMQSRYDRFRPEVQQRWRETADFGSGILFDLGPHLIDQALLLFGEPEALTARCRVLRDSGKNTDYFQLQLHYADKEVCLSSSPFAAATPLRFEVQGSQATFRSYGLDPQEEILRFGQGRTDPRWAVRQQQRQAELSDAGGTRPLPLGKGHYSCFYQQLALALHGQAPLPVTVQEALHSVKAIELALQSADTGKTLNW
ncbi:MULTISPECIES: Gfo/Idh/MocA family oxidoreductase [Rheinheimera]|uniref:Gfo/Idh/MocA family oxidoreductase n=1 Tax=Rheinheimera marina TaxID=1774958 RepID=A0ABV9JNV0_9GAMM